MSEISLATAVLVVCSVWLSQMWPAVLWWINLDTWSYGYCAYLSVVKSTTDSNLCCKSHCVTILKCAGIISSWLLRLLTLCNFSKGTPAVLEIKEVPRAIIGGIPCALSNWSPKFAAVISLRKVMF